MTRFFLSLAVILAIFAGIRRFSSGSDRLPPSNEIESDFSRLTPENTTGSERLGSWQKGHYTGAKDGYFYTIPFRARVTQLRIERKPPFITEQGHVPVGAKTYPVTVTRDIEREYKRGDIPEAEIDAVFPRNETDSMEVFYYESAPGLWSFGLTAKPAAPK